jgi:hypothetical protein
MDIKAKALALGLLLSNSVANAGSAYGGTDYTNFGNDLRSPIFLSKETLKIYKNKNDSKPLAEFRDLEYINLAGTPFLAECLGKPDSDGWVKCSIKGRVGWVQRSDFLSGSEYRPVTQWPIRYWLTIASTGMGGDGLFELEKLLPRSPYLVTQKEFANIFFKVFFDKDGFAISSKTGKRTGDRVFKVGKGIYLAPADDAKREKSNWLFLNYFEPSIEAMCPSLSKESCYSAANQSPDWQGIKLLHTSPAPQFAYSDERQEKENSRWYGYEEVAFARFSDPVKPLMYYVPNEVDMAADGEGATDQKKLKNRDKPFCIIDCK